MCSHLVTKMSRIPSVQEWTNLTIRYGIMLLFTVVSHPRKWAWVTEKIWTFVIWLRSSHCRGFCNYTLYRPAYSFNTNQLISHPDHAQWQVFPFKSFKGNYTNNNSIYFSFLAGSITKWQGFNRFTTGVRSWD